MILSFLGDLMAHPLKVLFLPTVRTHWGKGLVQIRVTGNGVLSQVTKNKTYTPKNICSSASKDRSHGEYLA